jgi:hypothetical protein
MVMLTNGKRGPAAESRLKILKLTRDRGARVPGAGIVILDSKGFQERP